MEALSGLYRDGLAVVVAPLLYLGSDPARNWPPALPITLKAAKTTIIGYEICSAVDLASSTGVTSSVTGTGAPAGPVVAKADGTSGQGRMVWQGPLPQQQLVAGVLGTTVDGVQVNCQSNHSGSAVDADGDGIPDSPFATSSAVSRLAHAAMLDLGQMRGLIQLQQQGNTSRLDLRTLTLLGLAQGPAVAAASQIGGAGSGRARRMLMQAAAARLLLHASSSSASRSSSRKLGWRRKMLLAVRGVSSSRSGNGCALVQRQATAAAGSGAGGAYQLEQQQQLAAAAAAGTSVAVAADGSGGVRWMAPYQVASVAAGTPVLTAVPEGPNGAVLWVPHNGTAAATSKAIAAVTSAHTVGAGSVQWLHQKLAAGVRGSVAAAAAAVVSAQGAVAMKPCVNSESF